MDFFVELMGYLGGFFIMLSFIPQVIKSYKTKKVDDISTGLAIASVIGGIFWEIYGFMVNSMPLIIMNGIFCILVVILLVLKLKYNKV